MKKPTVLSLLTEIRDELRSYHAFVAERHRQDDVEAAERRKRQEMMDKLAVDAFQTAKAGAAMIGLSRVALPSMPEPALPDPPRHRPRRPRK